MARLFAAFASPRRPCHDAMSGPPYGWLNEGAIDKRERRRRRRREGEAQQTRGQGAKTPAERLKNKPWAGVLGMRLAQGSKSPVDDSNCKELFDGFAITRY